MRSAHHDLKTSGTQFIGDAVSTCDHSGHRADSDESDLARAIDAARKGFESWRVTSLDERARVMLAVADLIEARSEELALAESVDKGKPVSLARRVDIPRASANFRFFAHALTQFSIRTR